MTVRLALEPLKTPRLTVDQLDKAVREQMKYVGAEMKGILEKTTENWKGAKPTFNVWMPKEAGRIALTVYPAGNALGVKKWKWLDEGTKVRYAVMSRDWVSKTLPGNPATKTGAYWSTGQGRGRMVFVSKKKKRSAKWPRPGIKARAWSKALANQYKDTFADKINNAVYVWANTRAWQNW